MSWEAAGVVTGGEVRSPVEGERVEVGRLLVRRQLPVLNSRLEELRVVLAALVEVLDREEHGRLATSSLLEVLHSPGLFLSISRTSVCVHFH